MVLIYYSNFENGIASCWCKLILDGTNIQIYIDGLVESMAYNKLRSQFNKYLSRDDAISSKKQHFVAPLWQNIKCSPKSMLILVVLNLSELFHSGKLFVKASAIILNRLTLLYMHTHCSDCNCILRYTFWRVAEKTRRRR